MPRSIDIKNNLSNKQEDNTRYPIQDIEFTYQDLYEHAPITYLFVDRDGLIKKSNKAAQNLLGYSSVELYNMKIIDLYANDYRIKAINNLKQFGRDYQLDNEEITLINKNGNRVNGLLSAVPVKNNNGHIIASLQIIHDIKEIKMAEMNYQTIIKSTLEGFWIINIEGNFVEVNDAFCQMIGYTKQELLSMHVSDIDINDSISDVKIRINKIKEKGSLKFISQHKRKDNKIIDVEISANYLNTNDEKVYVFIRDITEQKRLINQLRNSEERYRLIVDTAYEGIVIADKDGTYKYANKRMADMLGYQIDEIIGNTTRNFIFADWVPKIKQIRTKLGKGHFMQGEFKFRRKDGSILWTNYNAAAVYDKDRRHIASIGMHTDITERKKIEEIISNYETHLEHEIENRTEELRLLNKKLQEEINLRTELTRAIIHELKTPLTPLLSASEYLVSNIQKGLMQSFAKNIQTGAKNLENRINNLLDLTKGELGLLDLKYQMIDIQKIIIDTIEYYQAVAVKRRQSLQFQEGNDIPLIWCDKDKMTQVIINLLDNASKYTRKGGRIIVSIDAVDKEIIIKVADTGIGIPQKSMQLLFKPYARLHKKDTAQFGLGLGLAICKMFIALHNGRIWVKSTKGKGSSFFVSLPIIKSGKRISIN